MTIKPDDKKPTDKPAPQLRSQDERKEGEDLTPTPTQAENDEAKIKVMGSAAPKLEKRGAKEADEPPEALPPTPTQAENDTAKLAACNEDPPPVIDNTLPPEGGGTRRSTEADKPGTYTTRTRS